MNNLSDKTILNSKTILTIVTAICVALLVSPSVALIAGIVFSYFVRNQQTVFVQKTTNWLLKISVIGLGFNMNVKNVMDAGKDGIVLIISSIAIILIAGIIIGKWLYVNRKTSHLIASGTAICGGSAIAILAPIIKASEKEISISMGIIFLLNTIALITFPFIGNYFELTQHQFGIWSAIAIHDTSSVIGAATVYGQEALQTATVVKLSRMLWIVPIALITMFAFSAEKKKVIIPWIIIFFITSVILNSYVDYIQHINKYFVQFSKTTLIGTIFLVGTSISVDSLRSVGWRPLLLGILLWLFISALSLIVITW